jgi:hypothetical protein
VGRAKLEDLTCEHTIIPFEFNLKLVLGPLILGSGSELVSPNFQPLHLPEWIPLIFSEHRKISNISVSKYPWFKSIYIYPSYNCPAMQMQTSSSNYVSYFVFLELLPLCMLVHVKVNKTSIFFILLLFSIQKPSQYHGGTATGP